MIYDLIIIGAGPAGFSAAIYAARKKLSVAVVTDKVGGQASLNSLIENYAGISSISGADLIFAMRHQAENYQTKIIEGVTIKQIRQNGKGFVLLNSGDPYRARAVLIASGKIPRRLNVPGESELEGRGVSFCSTCDAPLFGNKDVAVVGGGNAGLDTALDLTKYANKIYVLEFSDRLLGDELTQEKLRAGGKTTFILNAATKSIEGKGVVEGLVYEDRKTSKVHSLKVNGVFVAIGSLPSSDFVKDLVKLNDRKEIVIDLETNATSASGIFAAGDVTNTPFKQCIIAAGEGAKAALQIYDYLQSTKAKS